VNRHTLGERRQWCSGLQCTAEMAVSKRTESPVVSSGEDCLREMDTYIRNLQDLGLEVALLRQSQVFRVGGLLTKPLRAARYLEDGNCCEN
jgi:hypothetical protein